MLRRLWTDWVLPLLIAVGLALVIRSYVAEGVGDTDRLHGTDDQDR